MSQPNDTKLQAVMWFLEDAEHVVADWEESRGMGRGVSAYSALQEVSRKVKLALDLMRQVNDEDD